MCKRGGIKIQKIKVMDSIIYKYMSIAVYSTLAYFVPVKMLFILLLIAVFADFVTGVVKSSIVAKKENVQFVLSARKMAKTVFKFIAYSTAIVLAFMIDKECVSFVALNAANYVCLFIVLVELWSIIENCVVIFPHNRFFMLFKSVIKHQVKKHTDIDIESLDKPKEKCTD